jgi:membrane-associated protease RseP (regulator of RpoE activity)
MQLVATNVPLIIAGFTAALIVTTLVHELGHLAAARLLRIPVRRVAVGMGPIFWRRSLNDDSEFVLRAIPTGMSIGVPGRRNPDGTQRRPIHHDVLMAAAGPAMSLLLAALFLGAAQMSLFPIWLRLWLTSTALLSGFLGLTNLIPVPGLDGGHLLLLGAASLGLQLSPEREMQAHHVGVRLVTVACLAALLATLVMRFLALL